MRTAMPLVIVDMNTEPRRERPVTMMTPPARWRPGRRKGWGHHRPIQTVISTHARTPYRPYLQRLHQALLRVAPHRAEGEEHRQNRAQEERCEHRQAHQSRARERTSVDEAARR